ncbi:bacterio-opsin activator domain-containing protein [Halocatena salina]|uniref:Bacterioopsin transcriptional activator GAF and HTH associated domain-containing protein n=1 Tax=Halocatena salina TaxID=2934340 RepID=A0A8U0A853_9EURY|nr:bacterio-opsin activator domain-containing protein [Halocatena salina]UPM45292.1 hypothetical protein MW046_19290 [Halocatena salina]
MSVVADFTVPAQSFALAQALTAEPDMTVEAERQATHSSEWVLPFLWASGGEFETFHDAMRDDPTVATQLLSRKPVRASCIRSNGIKRL